jgi:hypothetical protein
MFGFVWKILPDKYKFSVAFKKMGQMAGKATVGLIAGSAIGNKLSPEHFEAVSTVVTVLTTAGLEYVHDWAKMKWPDNKWL